MDKKTVGLLATAVFGSGGLIASTAVNTNNIDQLYQRVDKIELFMEDAAVKQDKILYQLCLIVNEGDMKECS